jgi:hypothetical protein
MVSTNGAIDRTMMAAVMAALLVVNITVLAAGITYSAMHQERAWITLATTVLALAFIMYEVVLALKNAIGQEAAYASFAICRNVLSLALGVWLVVEGYGPLGPVFGLLIATTLPLVLLPGARRIWSSARPSWAALERIRPHLGHGLAGGIALGTYILVNAPTRNLFAQQFGANISGIWTLCADLSYGPLAVLGNAYGLSQIRLIYLSASSGDTASLQRRARALLESMLALTLPYSIGAYLFAQDGVKLLLVPSQGDIAATIVVPATLQGASLLLLYSLTSIMLAWRRLWLVVVMVSTVAIATTLGASARSSIVGSTHAAMDGSLCAIGFWLVWGLVTGFFHVRWLELAKLMLASMTLWASATVTMMALKFLKVGNAGWMAAIGMSGICFAAMAIWLRLSGFTNMIPPAIRRFIPHLASQSDDN